VGFGERLQREREMRGITLDEIAAATKIGSRSLRALEQEEFSKLPGGIFNKGFVRAYARYLGIDEEQAVADYLAAIGEPADPALDAERLHKLETNWKPHKTEPQRAPARIPWLAIALLIAVLVVLFAGWRYRSRGMERLREWRARRNHSEQRVLPQSGSTAASPPAVAAAPAGAPPGEPSPLAAASQPPQAAPGNTGSVPPENTAPASPEPTAAAPTASAVNLKLADAPPGPSAGQFVLQIHAAQDCWLSVVADGRAQYRGTLAAGRDKTISAQQKILLTAGNASALELRLNGAPVPKLGESKEVRTVTITTKGIHVPEPQRPREINAPSGEQNTPDRNF
jgi:cytoskeleton protein RodZ